MDHAPVLAYHPSALSCQIFLSRAIQINLEPERNESLKNWFGLFFNFSNKVLFLLNSIHLCYDL